MTVGLDVIIILLALALTLTLPTFLGSLSLSLLRDIGKKQNERKE